MTFRHQLTILVTVLTLFGGAGAVQAKPDAKTDQAAAGKVGPKVGKPLQEAQALANKGDFQGAMAKINEAQAVENKNPAEQSVIYEFEGYVALHLNDYVTAAQAYSASYDAGLTPADKVAETLSTLTKLYYQNKDYPNAIKYGSVAEQNGSADIAVATLVAQSYYLQKDFTGASKSLHALIDIANKTQAPVQEDWLKLLQSSEFNNKNSAGVMNATELLLEKFPSDTYWTNAINLIEDTGGKLSDAERLQLLRLKIKVTKMQPPEYTEMAQIALRLGFPGDAKTALEKGFSDASLGSGKNAAEHNSLLEQARSAAQSDKSSLPALAKEVANSKKASAQLGLGEAYLTYGQCQNAVDTITQGIGKQVIPETDLTLLDLGNAYACNNQTADAVATFNKVPTSSKLYEVARLWIISLHQVPGQTTQAAAAQ